MKSRSVGRRGRSQGRRGPDDENAKEDDDLDSVQPFAPTTKKKNDDDIDTLGQKSRSRSREPRVDKSSPTALNAVEQQTQLAQQEGTMVNAIMKGKYALFFELLSNEEDHLEVLHERDAVGATCLHWACLMNHQPGSLRIARRIIREYPERCADMYTGEEYEGENCLHIAIVNQNFDLVRALVEACPEQMDQHATGLFFCPSTKKKKVSCYYGELALSFATSTNQIEIVRYLLDHGADITNQDTSNGNNCMHMAVICDNVQMFDHLSEEWEARKMHYQHRRFDSSFDCGFAGSHLMTYQEAL
jgi:ankyrin repeat protein